MVRKVIPTMDDLQYSLTGQKCQDLIINRSIGMKYLAFDSAANSIAGRFLMAYCKNVCVESMSKSDLGGKGSERPYSSCTAQHSPHYKSQHFKSGTNSP